MVASPAMTAIDELRRSIEAQLVQIEDEARALRRALDALGRSATPDSPETQTDPTTESPARRRTPRRSSAVVVPAERLAALLHSADGLSTAEIAERTGGERDQILALLRELEQAGHARRSGERRGTRWHAITDEDRIAQRAAELEAQQLAQSAEREAGQKPARSSGASESATETG